MTRKPSGAKRTERKNMNKKDGGQPGPKHLALWKKDRKLDEMPEGEVPAKAVKKHGSVKKVLAVLAVILLVLALWLGISYAKKIGPFSEELETDFFHMYSEKIMGNETIRLVVLSDLHNAVYGEDNSELVEKVRKLSPDLILLAGDMVDKKSSNTDIVVSLCSQLKEIAPVYYGLGNHEGTMMYVDGLRVDGLLRDEGITVLVNQSADITVKGTTISIGSVATGIYNFDEYSAPFMEEFEQKDTLKILIAHFPDLFYERLADVNVDLAVAGHYHGGQVQIPFLGGLYSADHGLFPKYCDGMFTLTNAKLFVTRGVGNSHKFPRINNRPQIAVIDMNTRKDGTVAGSVAE